MQRIASVLLCVVFVAAAAPPAHADEPADAHARAEALLTEGVELRRDGREGEALERFRRAYALEPTARARAQIGLAAKSMRLYVEAERALGDALAAADDLGSRRIVRPSSSRSRSSRSSSPRSSCLRTSKGPSCS